MNRSEPVPNRCAGKRQQEDLAQEHSGGEHPVGEALGEDSSPIIEKPSDTLSPPSRNTAWVGPDPSASSLPTAAISANSRGASAADGRSRWKAVIEGEARWAAAKASLT